MFESFRAAAGDSAFSFQGRLLCSKFDPKKEAAAFIDARAVDLGTTQTAFILGLAGGHVIDAICRAYPCLKVVVLEVENEIIEGVSRQFAFNLMNVEIIRFADVTELKKNATIRKGLGQAYCVITQPVTSWLHKELYAAAEELLLGRAPGALTFVLAQRQDLREALRPLLQVNDSLATIKTLNQNLNNASGVGSAQTKLLIKTLRELVI